jgi:hypothetical protein
VSAQLLAPIDLTGEPTVWAFQELQFWEPLRRAWVRQSIRPALGPSNVWRAKVSELEYWDPFAAWPVHMGERRGGYRARLLVWDGGKWQVKRSTQ